MLQGETAWPCLASRRPQLLLMSPHQVGHAIEAKMICRRLGDRHGGAGALLFVAAVDPARGQAEFVGGPVIVKQAFRGVEYLVLADAALSQFVDHVFEILVGWLI